jgi:dTMP kinase
MTQGKFITFEGGEGSGKSTQARRLADTLQSEGYDVVLTREPGGTPFAEAVRKLILANDTPAHSALSEALLFYAARADHLEKVIRPALAAGRWVICDRFSDSTRVYQAYGGDLPQSAIDMLEGIVVKPTVPDLTVIVDMDPQKGLDRADSRRNASQSANDGPDAYEVRDVAFHERLRAGFLAVARTEPQRCVVVDGSRGMDEVTAAVREAVGKRLLAGAT